MQTFEYSMRPNRGQAQQLMAVLMASRKLYNTGLEELITTYKATGKHLHLYEQDKKHGKAAHPDLPAVVVDTTLKRLHRACAHFFRGCREGQKIGFPRFKGGNRWDPMQLRDAQHTLKGSSFHAPRPCGGTIRVNLHRPLQGTFKSARFVLRPSGWHLQGVCETVPSPLPVQDNAVGLDMGMTSLVADSTGRQRKHPKNLQRSAETLSKAQRRLARCTKGSARRRKAQRVVARHHERIVQQRQDTLHKISRAYVNGDQMMAIADLRPAHMGRNHALARAISDASWGQ